MKHAHEHKTREWGANPVCGEGCAQGWAPVGPVALLWVGLTERPPGARRAWAGSGCLASVRSPWAPRPRMGGPCSPSQEPAGLHGGNRGGKT